jgi:hypothetical protein
LKIAVSIKRRQAAWLFELVNREKHNERCVAGFFRLSLPRWWNFEQ